MRLIRTRRSKLAGKRYEVSQDELIGPTRKAAEVLAGHLEETSTTLVVTMRDRSKLLIRRLDANTNENAGD